MPITAIVLCGGESRRFGRDKTRQPLGETSVLDRLIMALPADWVVVAVGVPRQLSRPVTWAREDPPGGGPLAGIASGLACATTNVVVVVAGDMPFASGAAVRLADALGDDPSVDAVVALDGAGRQNPLLAAYRSDAVRAAMPPQPGGAPARLLLTAIRHTTLRVDDDEALDVDTPQALDHARHRLEP